MKKLFLRLQLRLRYAWFALTCERVILFAGDRAGLEIDARVLALHGVNYYDVMVVTTHMLELLTDEIQKDQLVQQANELINPAA
ncbi:hypothetical protein [Hymenobacter sp. 102]|uniref:hypothetical protein n=1 Tax=Hymenobacter sp. 102 TaxID=3403152 RepID=UPI003CE76BB6